MVKNVSDGRVILRVLDGIFRDVRNADARSPHILIVHNRRCDGTHICGADDFVVIADFGKTKRKWFARFLDLSNGIPSHDRFKRSWPRSSRRSLSNVCSVGSRRCTRLPTDKWLPSTARRSVAVSTRLRVRRRFTWSAPGPRSGRDTLLFCPSCAGRFARWLALAAFEGDRDGHQHYDPRW